MTPRSVFFGTPEFAVPSLQALAKISTVCAVVCQPDRPKGRGLALEAPPVKLAAAALEIPVVQPTKLRTGEFSSWLRAQYIDLAVVVAYGRILPRDVLDAPRLGCLNVHASLLPAYRGAAPIAWALLHGERESGVTLMQLDEGMDTGPLFASARLPIHDDDTTGTLSTRLSELGAALLNQKFAEVIAGSLPASAQPSAGVSLAPPLRKTDGLLDFSRSAIALTHHVRGMAPWPGAYAFLGGKRVTVHEALATPGNGAPGVVVQADKSRLLVGTGAGLLELRQVQPEGKRSMRAHEWVAGRGVSTGHVLGAAPNA